MNCNDILKLSLHILLWYLLSRQLSGVGLFHSGGCYLHKVTGNSFLRKGSRAPGRLYIPTWNARRLVADSLLLNLIFLGQLLMSTRHNSIINKFFFNIFYLHFFFYKYKKKKKEKFQRFSDLYKSTNRPISMFVEVKT